MIEEAESVEQKYVYLSLAFSLHHLFYSLAFTKLPLHLPSLNPLFLIFQQELQGESGVVEEEEIGAKGF